MHFVYELVYNRAIMLNPEGSFNSSELGVARIVIADTIKSAVGDEDMLEKALIVLYGPDGDDLAQSFMDEYLGTGGESAIDKRVLQMPVINVHAVGLKGAMTSLLESYFSLPDKARTVFFEGLTRFGASDAPASTSKQPDSF